MTRPGKPRREQPLAALLATDPTAAVLRVLERAGAPLTAGDVKAALRAGGVGRADADRAWKRVQERLRSHPRVAVDADRRTLRYRWLAEAAALPARAALARLGQGRLPATTRADLVAVVAAALAPGSDPVAAARQRQAAIDAVRALAELAIEVEQLTVDEASPEAMIERVRARVRRSDLEPVDRAGEQTTFDRRRHTPIGRSIRDGAPVVVVRPGYVWKAPTEDVLIAKATVEE